MPTYVALLRSVNVGGRNRVAMDDLRSLVIAAGYRDPTTYVQSGNVVFSGRGSPQAVGRAVEARMATELGWSVPVIVRSKDQLEAIVGAVPFDPRDIEAKTVHLTVLSRSPDPDGVESLQAEAARFGDDRAMVIGREVYLHCPGGYGKTKLNNTFLERRLGCDATTRNWRTVTTLAGMAGIEA